MPIESKFAKLLTELGFKKVGDPKEQGGFILAKVKQMGKPLFIQMHSGRITCTIATDERGCTWLLERQLSDLRPHGFVAITEPYTEGTRIIRT